MTLRRTDEGFSLVETMVAIAVIGIAVTTIMGGLGVATRSSSLHRAQADAEAVLRSSGEAIKRQAYAPCPGTAAYTLAEVTAPTGMTVAVTRVERWNGTAFQDACPSEEGGFQRVTVRATAANGAVARDFQVVKRR